MGTEPPIDALARFCALSPAIRGCAVVRGADLVAATGDPEAWLPAAADMLDAADRAAGAGASHAHVATEAGEVYALRSDGYAMVAVTDRFALASLTLADMRATLRTVRSAAPQVVEAAS